MYKQELNIKEEVKNIRFFFGGVELKDDNLIYQYSIQNNFTINVMIRKSVD